ncbi:Sugar kinase of the NBD/HSP70 family, may contain an N-terminal HTH domain [Loktanella fryxellensis]|uniref:Sugar kinase of the NBD/HSP70 family, may contain an N-terminal HTH domain n=1 Tax=Loktanella fryxellensis TaxID=245187 RepID=A0A1H8ITL2_9RHOB|nr:ROK family protein [Loktanella fryxellensis]SEN71366.1 Sugar kinase of the NBD/HSP70 family, may contain an N-terminal HTH domain [Loktanella fryxellensis]
MNVRRMDAPGLSRPDPRPGPLADRLVVQLRGTGAAPQADLAAAGWLDDVGRFVAGAGCLFGSDVGGTKVQSVLTDLNGAVLAEMRGDTPAGGGDAVLDLISAHLAQLTRDVGLTVRAAGIGLPGAVHPATGHLDRAPNLGGLAGRDMRALLHDRLGVPVAVENDVNLAALGEAWLGHGVAVDGAVSPDTPAGGLAFVALGTGIGMGLVWGDRILRGASGAAGEVAALPIGADPADPASKGCGALESVVSGVALVADYRATGGRQAGETLRQISRDAGADPALDAVMARLAQRTARAILAIDAIVNPALFVLGGGVGSQPLLLDRIMAELATIMPDGMPVPDCRTSQLGNRAGALGAARVARLAYADQIAASS